MLSRSFRQVFPFGKQMVVARLEAETEIAKGSSQSAGAAACAALTGGGCLPLGGIAITGELVLTGVAAAATVHGGLVLLVRSGMEGGGGESNGRSFAPGEYVHVQRIRAVNVSKYISKHPWALTEPATGPHVRETELVISRLQNSVDYLESIKDRLNPTAAAEANSAIAEGRSKIAQLQAWLSQNPNLR